MKISRQAYAEMFGPTTGDRKVYGFQGKVMGELKGNHKGEKK